MNRIRIEGVNVVLWRPRGNAVSPRTSPVASFMQTRFMRDSTRGYVYGDDSIVSIGKTARGEFY